MHSKLFKIQYFNTINTVTINHPSPPQRCSHADLVAPPHYTRLFYCRIDFPRIINKFPCIIQVINATKITGPKGRPGYNGTHGLLGLPGSPGNQGPVGPSGPGASNLTLCSYKKGSSAGTTSDTYASQDVSITESNVSFKV